MVKHPTGASPVSMTTEEQGGKVAVTEATIIRTARACATGLRAIPAISAFRDPAFPLFVIIVAFVVREV